jgi:hypothetical protein
MIIENSKYNDNIFHNNDFYIFAIGYEQRSYFLYDKILSNIKSDNSLIFIFDDYENHNHTKQKIQEIKKNNIIPTIVKYSDSLIVQNKILEELKNNDIQDDSITIHIDYSSMPRSWYCKLPILFQKFLKKNDTVYFWYSEGEYPFQYKVFPTAGIDDFSFFAGKPSLQTDSNRVHVLALGWDKTRTQAILSMIDPDYIVACYAYSPQREEFPESIKETNESILLRTAMSFALRLDDFSFMVSKLREIANELLSTGDVILIPDGPKPLIFAISLVPDLLNKDGITCLHVARNSNYFNPVNVIATGEIYGFSIRV